jgi:DUF2075 family protein
VTRRTPWGWASTVADYLNSEPRSVVSALEAHLLSLLGHGAAGSQSAAWTESDRLLRAALRDLAVARPDVTGWGITLEYELHLEGGRRPDAVLYSGDAIHVLEFKQDGGATAAALDQVSAYARDLAEYHQKSHNVPVNPVLVLTRATPLARVSSGQVDVISPAQLSALLHDTTTQGPPPDFDSWLNSPYEPLPTLVEAAKLIFSEQPLPRIRRAESAGIPEAVSLLARLAKEAERDSRRVLAFLAGVPGAGKTLAGLQLVYDRLADAHDSVFLSGNGPLVAVLRDALKNKNFVQDLHAFVTTYGTSTRAPQHHVIVFDEAQRAWDRGYMAWNSRGDGSEPDVLIQVGERLDRWCALFGLVGDGQEIHSGEEAGIGQWAEAIRDHATAEWAVHGPPRLEGALSGVEVTSHPELDLTISLRSRRADMIHAWVSALLEGELTTAASLARDIEAADFSMYFTRDLQAAKSYVVDRYAGDEDARFGVLASSRTQRFLPEHGVDSSWPATKKVNFGHWYNRPRGEPRAGGNLDEVVTEFGCQGLELDMPLVAWGDDVRWFGDNWEVKTGRPRYRQDDPRQLRLNAYRVLLTRGRDGFVIYLPSSTTLDATEIVLLAAGVRQLPSHRRNVGVTGG